MIKKFLLLFVSLIICYANIYAQSLYQVKADKLKIREKNDAKSKVIGFVKQNDSVAVIDSADSKFYKIKVDKKEGFVSKDFLTKIAGPKPVAQPKAVVAPQAPKNSSKYADFAFIAALVVVLGGIMYFVLRYADVNKYLLVFSFAVVAVVAYFCYITFIKQKTIAGVYTGSADAQYKVFNFKSTDSVMVQDIYTDSTFTAKYIIDGDMIKMYDQQNLILLLIRDENTLVGEGFTRGIFIKK